MPMSFTPTSNLNRVDGWLTAMMRLGDLGATTWKGMPAPSTMGEQDALIAAWERCGLHGPQPGAAVLGMVIAREIASRHRGFAKFTS